MLLDAFNILHHQNGGFNRDIYDYGEVMSGKRQKKNNNKNPLMPYVVG